MVSDDMEEDGLSDDDRTYLMLSDLLRDGLHTANTALARWWPSMEDHRNHNDIFNLLHRAASATSEGELASVETELRRCRDEIGQRIINRSA